MNETDTRIRTATVMNWKGYGQELERNRYGNGKGNGKELEWSGTETVRNGNGMRKGTGMFRNWNGNGMETGTIWERERYGNGNGMERERYRKANGIRRGRGTVRYRNGQEQYCSGTESILERNGNSNEGNENVNDMETGTV